MPQKGETWDLHGNWIVSELFEEQVTQISSKALLLMCKKIGIDEDVLKKMIAEYGVERLQMTATFLIAAGTDLTTVAGKLGHADSTTTQKVYSHLLQKTEQKTAQTMDDLLSNSIINAKKKDLL